MDAFFMSSHFSLTVIDSHGTLHLAVGLLGMHSAVASMWTVTKLSYLLFGLCLSDVSWRVSKLFFTATTYWLLTSQVASKD